MMVYCRMAMKGMEMLEMSVRKMKVLTEDENIDTG